MYLQACYKGRKLKGKDLKVAWYRPPASPTLAVTSPTPVTAADVAAVKSEDDLGLDFDAELVSDLCGYSKRCQIF